MKILTVTHYYPPHTGGLEIVAKKQSESLRQLGHDVFIVTCKSDTRVTGSEENTLFLSALNFFDTLFSIPFPVIGFRAARSIKQKVDEADIVHIHDVFYMTSWLAYRSARKTNTPYVLTQHVGVVAHTNPLVRLIQAVVYKTIGQKIFEGAAEIVVYNPLVENFLLERNISTKKITRLENGVDINQFKPLNNSEDRVAIREAFGLPANRKLVLFVGRFVPKKGVDILLGARNEAFDIVLVGSGAVPKSVQSQPDVHVLPALTHDQLAKLYSAVDLFVFPAQGEIFTLVMQEAMASGTPVLASEEAEYQAYPLDTSRLRFSPRDTDSFRTNILLILNNPGLQSHMCTYSRELATQLFDWEKNIKRLDAVYTEIAARPKTVLLTAPYFPPHSGGLERYAKEVAARLDARPDWKVVVLTTGEGKSACQEEVEEGLVVYRLGVDLKISNTPLSVHWLWNIPKVLKAVQPDIVNIHTPVPGLGDLVSVFTRRAYLVVTYHIGTMHKGVLLPDILIWLYEQFFMPMMLRKADSIICSSDFVRDDFLYAYKHKSATISPAVDSDVFHPNEAAKADRPTLLFVASLSSAERKGLDVLLKAVKRLTSTFPNLQLQVVGDGEEQAAYELQAAEMNIKNNVNFLGRQRGEALTKVYQSAHVFCLPTKNDSSPMVITEAMASGLPVVSTPVGGIPLLVKDGETGFLLDPHDLDSLVDTLEKLLSQPELASTLGAAGRQRALEEFSWHERMERYEAILQSLPETEPTVVHVSTFYPPHLGGIENVVAQAARHRAKSGKPTMVVTTKEKGEELSEDFSILRLSRITFANLPFAPLLPLTLLRLSKKSIVHFHLAQAYWPECLLFVSYLRRLPYIVHFHLDVESTEVFGWMFALHKKLIWPLLMRRAQQVIVCSPEQVPLLINTYGVSKEKITVINNSVSDDYFSTQEYSPTEGVLKLLYVGRLAEQKRVERLIRAIALMRTPVTLTIAGDGHLREELEQLAYTKGVQEHVRFLGSQTKSEIQKLQVTHDAFVIASEREGLPLSVLEAMAARLPIIATKVIGLEYLVKDTGILIDKPYAENLAQTFTRLARDKDELLKLSTQSHTRAEDFREERFFAQVDEVYKTL